MALVRTSTLARRKAAGERITMLALYDYPSARIADEAGIDVLLVGDSLGNNVMGLRDTLGVTMDHMVHHTAMVARAAERAMVVADMPFLSYQVSPEEALRNAGRLVAEAGAHAVKLEGPADRFEPAMRAILDAGIPVMGHLGFTPQSVHQIGGYKVQGRGEEAAELLLNQARALERVGCFSIVLELVAAPAAEATTRALGIPTIGIGSGAGCDGQVLTMHDLLGFNAPRGFYKPYANLRETMLEAFRNYADEVKSGAFPGPEHSHQ
jgi:3-methyl-2-oxobutanoate hydroxymethyltransferase